MKKIYAFIVAVILFFIIISSYNISLNYVIGKNINKLYYMLDDRKFNSIESAKACLKNENSNNILVLGSSELSSFNTDIFNNGNSNFNMYLVGRGHTQCLQSALTFGAISEEVDIKKVVLILSPQWFESSGELNSEMFSSRFQKNTFNNFMKNEKISDDTKQEIINELKTLEVSDKNELEKIYKYESAYNYNNIINRIYLNISDYIANNRNKIKLIELLEEYKNQNKYEENIKFEEYDFEQLLEGAERKGNEACSNNDFGIYDEYYNTYIKEELTIQKNSRLEEDFVNEKEYEYLELFLDICEQQGIEPLIVNIPVNGKWYDYTGFTSEKRLEYYNRIREIVGKYNAELADFSNCEYEKYFLQDIMHLGWKGWIKVDEAIYKYYKK